MKKLFISVPMKGRTEENINKSREFLHKYAELMVGEELEVINSMVVLDPEEFYGDKSVYCLGESIKRMSKADYFVGIDYGAGMWHGCDIERSVAQSYGIPWFCVSWESIHAFADMHEVQRKYWDKMEKCCAIPNTAEDAWNRRLYE